MFRNKLRQKSPLKRFLFFFGLLFFFLYIGLGLYLIFAKDLPLIIDSSGRIMFGVVLIVYGFFRFYRLWTED